MNKVAVRDELAGGGPDLCRLFLQPSLLVLGVHQFLFGDQKLFVKSVSFLLRLTIKNRRIFTGRVTYSRKNIPNSPKLTLSKSFLSAILLLTSSCAKSSFSCSRRMLASWSRRFSLYRANTDQGVSVCLVTVSIMVNCSENMRNLREES